MQYASELRYATINSDMRYACYMPASLAMHH